MMEPYGNMFDNIRCNILAFGKTYCIFGLSHFPVVVSTSTITCSQGDTHSSLTQNILRLRLSLARVSRPSLFKAMKSNNLKWQFNGDQCRISGKVASSFKNHLPLLIPGHQNIQFLDYFNLRFLAIYLTIANSAAE